MTSLRFAALAIVAALSSVRAQKADILWDTYGVPHIYADDRLGLARAFGWAQMQNHGDLLLRLVAQSRGNASELLGADYLDEDRWVWTLGLPAAAERALAAQPPEMRAHLAAFVGGINAFADTHPGMVNDSLRAVLPVRAVDVIAHLDRVLYARFLASAEQARQETRAWRDRADASPAADDQRGSNAWAIAPKRSASGHTLLLQNPHLPWSDLFTWIEAEFVLPDMNLSGAALVLSPVLQIAFNDHLGWTHTVNTQDGNDLYELTLSGDGYLFDGSVRAFETSVHVIRVRQTNGSFTDDTVRVRRSVHGPVVAEKPGGAVAMSLVGLHGPPLDHAMTQWWNMARSRNFPEFLAAIRPNQISGQNITYADRDGHIMVFYGGNSPMRAVPARSFWSGIVRGDTSGTLWTTLHAFDDMPKTVDPPSGWAQNANDPPWWATFPPVVRPQDYPSYLASRTMTFRPQRSARMLDSDSSITWSEFLDYANSSRMELADRVLDDLLVAAKPSSIARARDAAGILERWDRRADTSSVGSVLFVEWWNQYASRVHGHSPFATPWSESAPRTTPDGLADTAIAVGALADAADSIASRYGRADVAWGTAYRLRRDGVDYPASGAIGEYGVFRVLWSGRDSDGKMVGGGGTSWVAAIEFASPVRAVSLVTYGNVSRAGSPHRTDQLALFARKQFKPIWRTRADVEAHLERKESLR